MLTPEQLLEKYPYGTYPFSELYLYTFYASVAQFEQANPGVAVPEWNPQKPTKRWAAPAEGGPGIVIAGRFAQLERVLIVDEKNQAVAGPDGRPVIIGISLERAELSALNMPPDTHTGTTDTGIVLPEIPCPLRAFTGDEAPGFDGFNSAAVHNVKAYQKAVEAARGGSGTGVVGGYLESDRAAMTHVSSLVEQIARRLGIVL